MTKINTEHLRKLLAAATQGPFEISLYEPPGARPEIVISSTKEYLPDKTRVICRVGYADDELAEQTVADAECIIALLNASGEMLDRIDELEEGSNEIGIEPS